MHVKDCFLKKKKIHKDKALILKVHPKALVHLEFLHRKCEHDL